LLRVAHPLIRAAPPREARDHARPEEREPAAGVSVIGKPPLEVNGLPPRVRGCELSARAAIKDVSDTRSAPILFTVRTGSVPYRTQQTRATRAGEAKPAFPRSPGLAVHHDRRLFRRARAVGASGCASSILP
jgi:hypothetical protein